VVLSIFQNYSEGNSTVKFFLLIRILPTHWFSRSQSNRAKLDILQSSRTQYEQYLFCAPLAEPLVHYLSTHTVGMPPDLDVDRLVEKERIIGELLSFSKKILQRTILAGDKFGAVQDKS